MLNTRARLHGLKLGSYMGLASGYHFVVVHQGSDGRHCHPPSAASRRHARWERHGEGVSGAAKVMVLWVYLLSVAPCKKILIFFQRFQRHVSTMCKKFNLNSKHGSSYKNYNFCAKMITCRIHSLNYHNISSLSCILGCVFKFEFNFLYT